MGRTKLPNARRKPIGTQVSEQEYAAVERARGDLERSVWIRGLILTELEAKGLAPGEAAPPPKKRGRPPKAPQVPARGQKPKTGPPASKAPPPPPPPPVRTLRPHAPGAPVFQGPGGEMIVGDAPPAPAATRTKCNHPIFRVFGSRDPSARGVDGCCPGCGHAVLPGGYWEPECDEGTCGH
jgi:hypothetical protein